MLYGAHHVISLLFRLSCVGCRGGRSGTAAEKSIYLTYLITGFAIGFSTFVFKFKASGHSAGIAGPVVALSHLVSPWFCLLGLVWLAAGYSSIKLLRHTLPEYFVGGAVAVAATFLSFAVFGLI